MAIGSNVGLFDGVRRLRSVDNNRRVVFSFGERRNK